MKQPDINARREYLDIVEDIPERVKIPGTDKSVKVRGVKPYTMEKLARLWLERDTLAVGNDSSDTLKSMCLEPYFAVREALLFVLNSYWKIKWLYRPMCWLWGKHRGYTEEQMTPIILAGKKKLPLMAHWKNMAFSVDMRNDLLKMTKKEAEQYQAELLSVVNPRS